MKKILYILSTVALIVSSCSKDIEPIDPNAIVAASFSDASITRVIDDTWQAGDKIGVYAYDEENYLYDGYINIPYQTDSNSGTATFTPASATQIYYPATGSLTFLAYSPYQDIDSDYYYSVDVSDQTDPSLIDLIVSNEGDKYSKDNPTAALTFSHALSKLTLILVAGEGVTEADLEDVLIDINNVSTKCLYDLGSGDIDFQSSDQNETVTPYMVTKGEQYNAILIPDTYSTMEVVFGVGAASIAHTWHASNITLQSGKEHIYTVTISESEIKVSEATINSWASGDDTDNTLNGNKTILVSTAAELAAIATAVNSGTTNYEDITIKLTQDIDLEGSESNQWIPIGLFGADDIASYDDLVSFNGLFDGCGNTISGLYMADIEPLVGLFGCIGTFGEVKNLTVEGDIILNNISEGELVSVGSIASISYGYISSCTTKLTIDVNVDAYSGGFVGWNYGVIENCVSEANVVGTNLYGGICCMSSGSIINCSNYADVNSESYVAGITLTSDGTIINCCNRADLNSSTGAAMVSGITTNNSGTIINSYNTGDVSGGEFIAGISSYNTGSIINSYNTGDVSGDDFIAGISVITGGTINNCYNTGGISGNDGSSAGICVMCNGTINNCYYLNNITMGVYVGSANVYSKTESQMKSSDFVALLNNNGYNYNSTNTTSLQACAWAVDSDSYPILDFNSEPEYTELDDDLDSGDIYTITSAQDLFNLATRVNSGSESYSGKTVTLTADIDLNCSTTNQWSPIGITANEFKGTFDGGGHTISGLYIESVNSMAFLGLFGFVRETATIKNLVVEGSINVTYSGDSNNNIVGGISAVSYGEIINCANRIKIEGTSYYSGGVVGVNSGTVTNCYNAAEITAIDYVGGITAASEGTITNCYNCANISSGNVAGAIVGYNEASTTNCYSLDGCIINGTGSVNGTVLSAIYMQTDDFVDDLNQNVYNYNQANTTSTQACSWVAVVGGYPILDFEVKAN